MGKLLVVMIMRRRRRKKQRRRVQRRKAPPLLVKNSLHGTCQDQDNLFSILICIINVPDSW